MNFFESIPSWAWRSPRRPARDHARGGAIQTPRAQLTACLLFTDLFAAIGRSTVISPQPQIQRRRQTPATDRFCFKIGNEIPEAVSQPHDPRLKQGRAPTAMNFRMRCLAAAPLSISHRQSAVQADHTSGSSRGDQAITADYRGGSE